MGMRLKGDSSVMRREEGVRELTGRSGKMLVLSRVAGLLVSCLPFLTGCASLGVRLGMRVDLSKIAVRSIELRQAGATGIGPGQKSSLIATLVDAKGKILQTEGAGHGKVLWRDLTVTPRVVKANKKGVISLGPDPRWSQGQEGHVTVAVASHADIHADLDIPLRYDYAFKVDFSGSGGMAGLNGSDGQDGLPGSVGSLDPNSPSPGGNGGNGSDGSSGQAGGAGGDAPAVEIRMTLAQGITTLLQISVAGGGRTHYFLVDPQGGTLTVTANGGTGGAGGKGGRGGRGGSGGVGSPNGSDGQRGLDGQDGMAGSDGRGGLITVLYDPTAAPYLNALRLFSSYGPKPVMRPQAVAPLW